MKKLYFIICRRYRKFEKPRISCIFEKALVLSIISICSICKMKKKKYSTKKNQLRYQRFLV